MAKQTYNQIKGAFPALDRKKVGKPFVMDGRNYLVDLDGPRSAFGFQCPNDKFTPAQFVQSFAVGTEIFYFARDAEETITQISTVVWPSQQVVPVLQLTTDPTRPKLNLPWSHAFVGTLHFFANRTAGVLVYDAINRIWIDATSTLGINNVFFVTESAGRLICLAEGISSWSAIDDGLDNVPSLVTGAGFQALSLVGTLESDADYLGLEKTSRGYLSFTRKGVLRSEIIDSLNPFRHLPGESKQTPLTAWNITKISDTEIVILSIHGLFKTETGFFEEWQPLQGEYFKNVEIPALQSQTNGFIAIHYSKARDEFFVSFAQAEGINQYTKAWVLYIKSDDWGSFNRVAKGFVLIDPEADGIDFKQAFIDNTGRLCYLDDSVVSLQMEAQNLAAIYVQPTLEYTVYQVGGAWMMPTNVNMTGFSKFGYPAIAGFYEELGEKDCYKTAEVGSVKVVSEIPFTALHDISAVANAFAFYVPNISIPVGATMTASETFSLVNGDNVLFAMQFAGSYWIQGGYRFSTSSFVNVFNAVPNLVDLGNGRYRFELTWVVDPAYTLFTNINIFVDGNVGALTEKTINVESINLVNDANPTVELMPVTSLIDPIWSDSGSFREGEMIALATDVTINGELCELGKTAQDFTQLTPDSFVEVGLFRLTDDAANDQLSLVTNVAISCLAETESTTGNFDDWLEDYAVDVFEDWLLITPDVFEDWGLALASGSVYTQKIRGSLDGYETFEDQFVDIEEVLIAGKTKFCSAANAGLFQAVEISALNVGESYHVKTLELNGNLIGRL